MAVWFVQQQQQQRSKAFGAARDGLYSELEQLLAAGQAVNGAEKARKPNRIHSCCAVDLWATPK